MVPSSHTFNASPRPPLVPLPQPHRRSRQFSIGSTITSVRALYQNAAPTLSAEPPSWHHPRQKSVRKNVLGTHGNCTIFSSARSYTNPDGPRGTRAELAKRPPARCNLARILMGYYPYHPTPVLGFPNLLNHPTPSPPWLLDLLYKSGI